MYEYSRKTGSKKKETLPLTYEQAYHQALRFLEPRFLSCQELRQKLKRKDVKEEYIDDIESKLIELDYLNDQRLAVQVLRLFMSERKYGRLYISNKMRLRGLTTPTELKDYDEVAVAVEICKKKFADLDLTHISYEMKDPRRKVISFLKNRGFSPSTMQIVLAELKAEDSGL